MDSKIIYQFGGFRLDPKSQAFYFQSLEIKLEPRIFDVLHLMLQKPGEVITKDEFFESVWQERVVSDWALSRAVKVLRKILLEHDDNELVKTLYGRGYLFATEVTTISNDDFLKAKSTANISSEQNDELSVVIEERDEEADKGLVAEHLAFEVTKQALSKPNVSEPDISKTERLMPEAEISSNGENIVNTVQKFGLMTLILVMVFVTYYFIQNSWPKDSKINSIVVLPIANINDNSELNYLSNGLTDMITGHLAKNQKLKVISTTSAQYYQNKNITSAEIAEKLNVDGIIEGSIFSVNEKLHMNVRLIDAKSEHLVWSFEEEGTLTEIYSFFQKIAFQVGTRVSPNHPTSEAYKDLVLEKTDRETFELYLKARYLLNRRHGKYLQDAATLLKKAISNDESFADAHASLASVYILKSSYAVNRDIDPFLLAKKHNDKALQLDPKSSLAWTNLGLIQFGYNYNFIKAQHSFEKAIEFDPNNGSARRAYAELLAVLSEYDRASSILENAWKKDSMNPLLIAIWGSTLMMDKQYEKALEKFELAKSLGSEMVWVDRDMAYIFQRLGDVEQSLKHRYYEMKNHGYFKNGDEQFIDATTKNGFDGFWRWRLPVLEQKWQENRLHACYLSEAYGGIGNFEKMLHWFKVGLEQKGESCFQLVKRSPEFYPFKDEPEFSALLSSYGISL